MLMSYTCLSDAELERWIYSSPHDVRALDEALNRLSTGEEKYTQDELDSAAQAVHDQYYAESPECGAIRL